MTRRPTGGDRRDLMSMRKGLIKEKMETNTIPFFASTSGAI